MKKIKIYTQSLIIKSITGYINLILSTRLQMLLCQSFYGEWKRTIK